MNRAYAEIAFPAVSLLFSLSGLALERNADFWHSSIAAKGELTDANLAQEDFGQPVDPDGAFAGRTVDGVASDLRARTDGCCGCSY